jgi:hypothetical protein
MVFAYNVAMYLQSFLGITVHDSSFEYTMIGSKTDRLIGIVSIAYPQRRKGIPFQ